MLAGLILLLAIVAGATVAAVVLAAGDEKAPSPAAAPPTVLPPQSFEAQAADFTVRLSWTPPKGGVPVAHYDIYRNGSLLVTLSRVASTYVDDRVRVGNDYTYEIAARGKAQGKEMTSDRVSALVTTPIPPLKAARVEGDYSVFVKTLSKSGYQDYVNPSYGWYLKPKCAGGACDIKWADLHEKAVHAVLERTGARYRGSYSGFFFVSCGGTNSTSSVKIDLKVVKAKAVDGQWLATKLVGTLRQSEVSQLGCVSSYATQALTAKLVR